MQQQLIGRIESFQGSESSRVLDLEGTPSAAEFAKAVAVNRPVVIRGQGRRTGTPSVQWSNRYLVDKLQGKRVSIAVSPNG